MSRQFADPLVSTAWLAQHLDAPDVRIVDASWFMPGSPRDAKAEFAESALMLSPKSGNKFMELLAAAFLTK